MINARKFSFVVPMPFIMLALLLAVLLAGCAETVSLDRKALKASDFAPADGVLVKFKPVAQGDSDSASSMRSRALQAAGISENAAFGLGLVPGLTRLNVPQTEITTALLQLRAEELADVVEYAEPNFRLYPAATFPTDPQFDLQWALNNTGQLAGASVDADIDAPEAWDLTRGDSNIIVAVIDTGVDYQHEDLANNIWFNFSELNGQAGIDDDNNGYVDDIRGWNFADNNNDPMDLNNHGTHVAGVIGAESNGIGVTGVNWNVKIMPLKFMGADGIGSTAGAISALNYAVAMGARISNNSWGGAAFSQALFDAIQSAGAAGHMFVAAAGNDGLNNDSAAQFPANFELDNVLSVAATDSSDGLAGFSNFGSATVDLAAPGVGIRSTLRNNTYSNLSGTSMSTPFVSGAAALLLAQNGNLTVSDIRSALLSTVDPVPSLVNQVASGGRLNVFNALNSITPGVPVAPVLSISPQTLQLRVGEQQSFVAGGGSGQYSWTSSSSINASINSNGLLTATTETAGGTVSIWATDIINGIDTPVATVMVLPAEVQPVNVNGMIINESVEFNVVGGLGPFQWSTVNNSGQVVTGLATVNVNTGNSRLATVTGTAAGQFKLRAYDTTGMLTLETQLITVDTVSTALPLSLSQTGTILVAPGDNMALSVSGGTPPYDWASNDSSLVSVVGNGSSAIVTAEADTPVSQPVRIRVVDATGQFADVFFNVRSPLAIASPGDTTVVRGGDIKALTAQGGLPPYRWSTSVTGVNVTATGDTSGAEVSVDATVTAGQVTVSVTDSENSSATQSLNIADPVAPGLVFQDATGTPSTTIAFNSSGQFVATGVGISWTVVSVPNGTSVTPRAGNPLIADVISGTSCNSVIEVRITDVINRSVTAQVNVTGGMHCF